MASPVILKYFLLFIFRNLRALDVINMSYYLDKLNTVFFRIEIEFFLLTHLYLVILLNIHHERQPVRVFLRNSSIYYLPYLMKLEFQSDRWELFCYIALKDYNVTISIYLNLSKITLSSLKVRSLLLKAYKICALPFIQKCQRMFLYINFFNYLKIIIFNILLIIINFIQVLVLI